MRPLIVQPLRLVLPVAAAAVVLMACGGDDDDSAGSSAAASAGSDAIVSTATVDGTDVLADASGRTLYSADVERGGRIRCVAACESFWMPVSATAAEAEAAGAELDVELGTVERPDGDRQLTLDGLPLYTFAEEDAGQLEGDGFEDDFQGTHFVWEAATTGRDSSDASQPSEPSQGSPYDY
jgi:predicted lipoprotein with Yx(FWY)xxD motif